jgi:HK97 family phage prohead protease
MTRKLISIDEFRSSARGGARPAGDAAVYRLSTGDAEVVDEAGRKLRFCFSDSTVDRAGDTIAADGWDISGFKRNPVALWAHNSSEPPIGRATNVGPENGRLMGDIEFAGADVYAFADTIFRLTKAKFINAVSVGFLPKEWSFVDDDERGFGIDFKRQELLEISVVPVPCNANALAEARAKGIDTRPLVQWAERTLDGGGKVIIPRSELERLRKAAKEPRSMTTRTKPGARRRDATGANETDPTAGGALVATCGRKDEDECGMKDPAECAVHGQTKILTLADLKAAVAEALKHLKAEGDEDKPEDGAEEHEKLIRSAHAHVKAASDLYDAAAEHHDDASECLQKALDALDDPEPEPEGEKAEGDEKPEDDPGTPEEHVRAAHAHMKAADDLYDQAEEHHDQAAECLAKAVDTLDKPDEPDAEDKAAQRRARRAARAAARRHRDEIAA